MKPYKNQDPIRLVLADVDGTLVTQQKVLTAKTKEAVEKLREAGILFATTSGRPPAGMPTVIKDVNLTTVVAGFNGGVFVTPRLDPIVTRDLPKDAAARALELISEHGLVAWLYTDTVWYVQDPKGPHVDRERRTVGFGPEVTSDYSPYIGQTAKIVGVSDDVASRWGPRTRPGSPGCARSSAGCWTSSSTRCSPWRPPTATSPRTGTRWPTPSTRSRAWCRRWRPSGRSPTGWRRSSPTSSGRCRSTRRSSSSSNRTPLRVLGQRRPRRQAGPSS